MWYDNVMTEEEKRRFDSLSLEEKVRYYFDKYLNIDKAKEIIEKDQDENNS